MKMIYCFPAIMANFLPSYLIKQSLITLNNDGYNTQLRLKLGEIIFKGNASIKNGLF
jgi:hypothetical protein